MYVWEGKGAWHSENMQIHLVHSAPISNESSGKNNIKQSEVFLKQKQKINRDRERERVGEKEGEACGRIMAGAR